MKIWIFLIWSTAVHAWCIWNLFAIQCPTQVRDSFQWGVGPDSVPTPPGPLAPPKNHKVLISSPFLFAFWTNMQRIVLGHPPQLSPLFFSSQNHTTYELIQSLNLRCYPFVPFVEQNDDLVYVYDGADFSAWVYNGMYIGCGAQEFAELGEACEFTPDFKFICTVKSPVKTQF